MYTTLIDPATLYAHHAAPDWVVVDCRFSLADTAAGQHAYTAAHNPTAVYAHRKRRPACWRRLLAALCRVKSSRKRTYSSNVTKTENRLV